jgi:hypothetical protein
MATISRHISIETFVPELLFEAVAGAGFEHRLLRGGDFVGQLDGLTLPNCRLNRGCYSLPCFTRGAVSDGWLLIGFTYCPQERGWVNGWELRHNQLQVYAEGLSLDYRTASYAPWYTIQVKREWLQEESVKSVGRELKLPHQGCSNLEVRHSSALALQIELDRLLTVAGVPSRTQQTKAAAEAEGRLIETLIISLSKATPEEMAHSRVVQRKRQFVERMERFLCKRLAETCDLDEVLVRQRRVKATYK